MLSVPGKVQYSRPQVLFENEVRSNVCSVEMCWCDYLSLWNSRSAAVQAAYHDSLHLSSSFVSPLFSTPKLLVYMNKFRQKNFTWASRATGAACSTNRGFAWLCKFTPPLFVSLCSRWICANFLRYLDLGTCAGTTEGERREEGSRNSKKTRSGSRS